MCQFSLIMVCNADIEEASPRGGWMHHARAVDRKHNHLSGLFYAGIFARAYDFF